MRTQTRFAFLLLLAIALGVSAVGCPCVRGAINGSESIRWWLFSNFGASKICPEALKRGVPIKLRLMSGASVGRFFPETCQVQVNNATQTIAMTAGGSGYVYLPVTRRVGFYAGVSVEFRPDFRLEEDAVYVWGRFNRMLAAPSIQLLGVENSIVSLATQTPAGDLATALGQGIVTSELARGFTVVRTDSGDDFAVGILMPPERPKHPYNAGSDRILLASDLTEVHPLAREYLGPFFVETNGSALFMKLSLAGAGVDYILVDKVTGDMWRQSYQRAQPLGPPPGAPLSYGQAGVGETKRHFLLPPGGYYLVLENRALPPPAPLGISLPLPDSTSYATYAAEVGEKP